MTENEPEREDASPKAVPDDGPMSLWPGHDDAREPIGQVLGDRFEVEEEIGSGAFAVTFRGRDLRLGRAVAIKVLRRTYAINPTFVQRFEREARAAASVSQSNVVDVYDFGQHGDLLYMVMQYIEGEDLKHLIAREAPLSPRRAAEITLQILNGLTAIHQVGIIHRDIKPQNVMIGRDGMARVTDFGIARATVDVGLTTAGTTVGTASYMAPEQAQAGELVEATDLYSVGIVLYEMLTGRLPFEAPTMIALMLAHIQTPPVPPSFRNPGQHIPQALDAVVMRALAKRPEDRFRDAPEMSSAVSAAARHVPPANEEWTRPLPVVAADSNRTLPRPTVHVANPPSSMSRPAAPGVPPVAATRRPARRGDRVLPLVLLLLLLLGGGLGGAALFRSLDDDGDGADDDRRALIADLSPTSTPTAPPLTETPAPTNTPEPTPTETPVPINTPEPTPTETPVPTDTPEPTPTETPVPTDTPEPTPTETPVPTDTPEPAPTETAVPPPTETPAPPLAVEPQTMTLNFAASDWEGGHYQETGNLRPWTGVYARSTGRGEATLRFTVDGEPTTETFNLTVDGMTSENWTELPITILINGELAYSGNSPFPTWNGVDGEQPWATANIPLPTSALLPGENTVTFVNGVSEGGFSLPPYILLADGTITIELRPSSGVAMSMVSDTQGERSRMWGARRSGGSAVEDV